MTKTLAPRILLLIVCVTFSGLACNAAQPANALPTVGAALSTHTPISVTAAPSLTPTPSPMPVPPGWATFTGDALRLSFYHPPDWTPAVIDESRVEIRPASGFAWMEISVIDTAHPGPDSLLYVPGSNSDAMAQSLLATLREDGAFDKPIQIATRGGQIAWVITGHNDRFEDDLLIGLIGLSGRAALLIGHQGEEGEDWEALKAYYEGVIQSVGE